MAYRKHGESWCCSVCDQPTSDQNDHSGCSLRTKSLGTTPAVLVHNEPIRYGQIVSANLVAQEDKLLHAILGMAEAAELIGWYKKWYFKYRGGQITWEVFLKEARLELGDTLFYTALANEVLFGDSLIEVAKDNIRKLQSRYTDKYTNVDLERMVL